jgi:hypothetical protein
MLVRSRFAKRGKKGERGREKDREKEREHANYSIRMYLLLMKHQVDVTSQQRRGRCWTCILLLLLSWILM